MNDILPLTQSESSTVTRPGNSNFMVVSRNRGFNPMFHFLTFKNQT
jgi:hypothetical protein